ncbi:hypothetical protein [Pseudomonas fluorescens]|uniref:hypothetical protein n=1 Tax=Pseudomonas fluorescens TaxID=294 RepID=UPI001398119D|nr:hypothetical protein [Pseudomonas fluorescens]QIA05800.1 hypothetical protein GZH78_27745 [Pseudomonas fluorescens]
MGLKRSLLAFKIESGSELTVLTTKGDVIEGIVHITKEDTETIGIVERTTNRKQIVFVRDISSVSFNDEPLSNARLHYNNLLILNDEGYYGIRKRHPLKFAPGAEFIVRKGLLGPGSDLAELADLSYEIETIGRVTIQRSKSDIAQRTVTAEPPTSAIILIVDAGPALET